MYLLHQPQFGTLCTASSQWLFSLVFRGTNAPAVRPAPEEEGSGQWVGAEGFEPSLGTV
jgi:hypothetical protein